MDEHEQYVCIMTALTQDLNHVTAQGMWSGHETMVINIAGMNMSDINHESWLDFFVTACVT